MPSVVNVRSVLGFTLEPVGRQGVKVGLVLLSVTEVYKSLAFPKVTWEVANTQRISAMKITLGCILLDLWRYSRRGQGGMGFMRYREEEVS